jgi:hemolysin activation/secretion protein
MSLERTRHLAPFGSSLVLDGSVFGAYSKRWDPAAAGPTAGDFTVGVVGLGLALTPRRPGRASVRLDYGFPLFTPPGVSRSPRLSITLMPWLETGRHRDRNETF